MEVIILAEFFPGKFVAAFKDVESLKKWAEKNEFRFLEYPQEDDGCETRYGNIWDKDDGLAPTWCWWEHTLRDESFELIRIEK